jgi:FHA domain
VTGDSLQNLRIRVVPGPGLVAVLGDVLLVVPSVDPGQEPALEALLAAAESTSMERAVARVVADFAEDQVPPFCLVAPGEVTGLFALVHGEVELSAEGAEGGARLRGREARTWVDRALPGGLQRLVVTTGSPAALDPDPYVDLRAGVVRGSAVLMTRRDAPPAETRGVGALAEPGGLPQGDTPRSDTPDVAGQAPAPEPSATWPAGRDDRFRAGGFRPEQIRFGEGGRIEPLDPSPARPLNGHDGRGRRAAPSAPAAADANRPEGPAPADDGPLAADPAPASASTAPPASASTAPPASVPTAPPASVPTAPPTSAMGTAPAEASSGGGASEALARSEGDVPAAVPAGPTGEGPAYLDITTTFAPAQTGAPAGADQDDPASPGAGAGSAEAPRPPTVRALIDTPPVPDGDEPVGSDRAAVAAPEPEPAGEESPFSARTQVVPPPLPGRSVGAVPPPAAVNPFGTPAPSAPFGSAVPVAPIAPVSPLSAPPVGLPPVGLPPVGLPAGGALPAVEPVLAQPPAGLFAEPARGRPGQGRLVIENAPDVLVDRDCVIGRNPEVDPDVAQGRARAVTLPDAEQRISRVHARLHITDAGVEIVDAGSVNGTWIEPPGSVGWIAMVPRVPAPLPLGSKIQVGDLVLTFQPAVPV